MQAGWLGEERTGEYYISNKIKGIFDGNFVFPKPATGPKPRSNSRKSTAPKGSRAKSGGKPDVFSEIDEFPTTMDGYPPYVKMKQNKEKLLWAVKFAKDSGVKGLANKDIEWLTDHLGDGIPNRQITAAFNSAKGRGFANRSTQENTIRITDAGETYLASVGIADAS